MFKEILGEYAYFGPASGATVIDDEFVDGHRFIVYFTFANNPWFDSRFSITLKSKEAIVERVLKKLSKKMFSEEWSAVMIDTSDGEIWDSTSKTWGRPNLDEQGQEIEFNCFNRFKLMRPPMMSIDEVVTE